MTTPIPLPPAIVLVDDEPDIRHILRRILVAIADGYDLVAVDNGAAALAVVEARPVPLLITDYNLGGMNGLDLARVVKAAAPTTTIVLLSASATPELEKRTQAVDYFLPKPFPFDQLEAIVRSTLS